MDTHGTADFVAGVIEGFYGKPWTREERIELFDWMAAWGLNTYFYAPKDDLKHRALWRERYSASETDELGQWIGACRQRKLRFIFALSPGLDIRYSNEVDLRLLQSRFTQLHDLGCEHFSLLFDDIPDQIDTADIQRWGSLASAQCHVANAMFKWTQERSPGARFMFCPTPYCGRMAGSNLGGADYLSTLGRELLPGIDVFWTGPEIISREITVAHVEELHTVLRRKPLIWDNLHANDYDGRRFYCGPYAGRPLELRNAVSGVLTNPNTEFPLNYIPLRTLAEFVRCQGEWNPRQAYLSAMQEWLAQFTTVGKPISLEDLIAFGDCYYLPHEEGPEAEALYQLARSLVKPGPGLDLGAPASRRPLKGLPTAFESTDQMLVFRKHSTRLRELCVRMTELVNRPLFHALSRRIWELREELDLLEQYVEGRRATGSQNIPSLTSHLPGTYRGGMVARLQQLLIQEADGTFHP